MPSPKPLISEANSRLSKIENFLLEHLPAYKDSPFLRQWLEWADASGFLIAIQPTEDDDSIVAAAVVRPISFEQLSQDYNSYRYTPDGALIYIDAAAAPNNTMRALASAMLARFGKRAGVAFKSKGKLKVHDHYTAVKALFKIKDNGQSISTGNPAAA